MNFWRFENVRIFRPLFATSLAANVLLLAAAGAFVYKKGGISYLLYKSAPDQAQSMYFQEREDVFKLMPQRQGAIVFLGDSLIERCRWEEILHRLDILNRGVGNDSVAGLNNRCDEVVRHRPRQVFLMAGINDLEYGRAPEQVVAQYHRLVAYIRKASPQTQIVIHSILPLHVRNFSTRPADLARRELTQRNGAIAQVNSELAKMTDHKKVVFLNLHHQLIDKNQQLSRQYSSDGLHLNGRGYEKWVEMIRPLVMSQSTTPIYQASRASSHSRNQTEVNVTAALIKKVSSKSAAS
jgi:lysophospholipase L1-like esterase